MNQRDQQRLAELDSALAVFADRYHPLPGIADRQRREVLLRELIVSLRRVQYPKRLIERAQSVRRTDPQDQNYFDPIRAAAYFRAGGNYDEACWMIFLFVHLGARKAGHWRLIRETYGRLGAGSTWSWPKVSAAPQAFAEWLGDHAPQLTRQGAGRGFGNHRKFESLDNTGRTVETYVTWVGPHGHKKLFNTALVEAQMRGGNQAEVAFDVLYRDMDSVWRFGRLAKFDYLCMLEKLALAPIQPGATYMNGATGPAKGARLLFTNNANAALSVAQLEDLLRELDNRLRVGKQVLEDALCNWQKHPETFMPFHA